MLLTLFDIQQSNLEAPVQITIRSQYVLQQEKEQLFIRNEGLLVVWVLAP